VTARPANGRVLYEGARAGRTSMKWTNAPGLDAPWWTNRIWTELGYSPETHAARRSRYGEAVYGGASTVVGCFEISGAVPPAHLAGGLRAGSSSGAASPPMYFRLGGGSP